MRRRQTGRDLSTDANHFDHCSRTTFDNSFLQRGASDVRHHKVSQAMGFGDGIDVDDVVVCDRTRTIRLSLVSGNPGTAYSQGFYRT